MYGCEVLHAAIDYWNSKQLVCFLITHAQCVRIMSFKQIQTFPLFATITCRWLRAWVNLMATY